MEPESVFWAISKKDVSDGDEQKLIEKALPLFLDKEESLKGEIQSFRNKIDISAVYINPTDRCNGNCPYCYIPKEDRVNGRHMDPDDLDNVLKKIEEYHKDNCTDKGRKPVVIFHGSEPLMVKKMLLNVFRTFKGRIIFGLQTNATLLEERDVQFLIEQNVSVGISLDSYSDEQNGITRKMEKGVNAYDSAVNALKWFDGYKGLSVITTITSHNLTELSKIIKFLHSYKVKAVLLNPVRCTAKGTAYLRPDNIALFYSFKQAIETAIELNKTHADKIVISDFVNIILAIIAPTARRLMCDITPCGGGRRFFTIMSDMTTAPCGEFIGLKEFHSVNLKTHSISRALESASFNEVRSRVAESITGCSECLYKNICGAPCPAEVYAINGTMNHGSEYCDFYKELIDYAFELIARDEVKNLMRSEMFNSMESVYSIESSN
jgi:uncharacterized protein